MDVARPPAVPDAGEWHGTLNQTGSGAKPVGRVRMIVGQEGAFTASVTQGTTGEEGGIWAGAFQPSGAIDGEFTQGMQSWSVTGTVAREGERVVGVLTLAKSNYAADRVGAELELRRGPAPSPAAKAPPP